tara:strand:+ start:619 stop:1770 length:1152 start_codon:yes stop_codon:yes gene_type:complete
MPLNTYSNSQQFIPAASFYGVFPSTGFQTHLMDYMPYSSLSVSLRCDKAVTISLYSYPDQNETHGKLVFQKTLTADTNYFKRFSIEGMFFSLTVTNNDAVEGELYLATLGSNTNQYDSATLLNSTIDIDTNTNLTRVANNFNTDMVRGLHDSFTKVNIQAILNQSAPSTTRTLGCQDYQFNVSTSDNLYIFHPNANDDSTGTGARTVRIIYVDGADTIQSLDYTITGGGGSVFSLGISGKMVHRAFVLTSGSSNANVGQITITNVSSTVIYASIEPTENTSHVGLYLVPSNSELIVSDVNIVATGMSGMLRINERDYTNSQLYSVGDFPIDTKAHNYTYNINGIFPAGNAVQIDFIPDAGTPTVKTLINVMVNGILSPIKNAF